MDLTLIQPRVSAANVPLDELAHNRALTKSQRIAAVAQKFEAVLLQQILQETQKPVFVSEFTDNSAAASIYRGLMTQQLANAIAQSGGFGLAKMLDQQLIRQLDTPSASGPDDSVKNPSAASGATGRIRPGAPHAALHAQFTAIPSA